MRLQDLDCSIWVGTLVLVVASRIAVSNIIFSRSAINCRTCNFHNKFRNLVPRWQRTLMQYSCSNTFCTSRVRILCAAPRTPTG